MADEQDQVPPQGGEIGNAELQRAANELKFRVASQLRAAAMNRLRRWIDFMQTPAFADINQYEAKSRVERGKDVMKQLEEAQKELLGAATVAAHPIADFTNQFMEIEDDYLGASARLH